MCILTARLYIGDGLSFAAQGSLTSKRKYTIPLLIRNKIRIFKFKRKQNKPTGLRLANVYFSHDWHY